MDGGGGVHAACVFKQVGMVRAEQSRTQDNRTGAMIRFLYLLVLLLVSVLLVSMGTLPSPTHCA